MQKYYQTLNKEEQAKIKETYQKEYAKSEISIRFTRLNIYIAASIFLSIILIIMGIMDKSERILDFSLAIILCIAATSFFIGKHIIKLNLLNKIALKNKNH